LFSIFVFIRITLNPQINFIKNSKALKINNPQRFAVRKISPDLVAQNNNEVKIKFL